MNHAAIPSVALVGVGRWGKNLARNFHALGALHTICDADPQQLAAFGQLYPSVRLALSLEEALKNPHITQVVIAAPAAQHYVLAKAALEAGRDVYVEKPLCLDCAQSYHLIQLAQAKRRILMVGHLLQYHPCVRALQQIAGRGELGKLQYITSNRLNLGHFRTEENALWNFAPHDISVILSLCNSQLPKQVRCTGSAFISPGVADVSLTTLRFDNDIQAHVYVSWINPFKEQKLTVVGSAGMAVFDDTKPWKEKLLLYRNHVIWSEDRIPIANPVEPEMVCVPEKEPLREECLHFLNCCETRTTPLTDGLEGHRVLQVLQAAQASLSEGGKAKNPLEHNCTNSLAPSNSDIHPTAIVHPGASVAPGVKIWHFSHVMEGASIGPRCNIGQNVVISPGVVLQENVKVQNNVSLYTGVSCEKDVFLGPSVVFTNIKNPRSAFPRRHQYVTTRVCEGASIGANATIVCGIELGHHCFIGAGAVVTRAVKPFALVIGNPGRQVGWMSRFGERLNLPISLPDEETAQAQCSATGELYQLRGDQVHLIPQD